MNSLNKVLLILLIAAVAAAGAIAWSGSRELRVANAAVEEYEQQLEEIQEKLTEVSFKNRGITESMENVPDSLRMTVTGEYRRKQQSYQKILIGYENQHREATRLKKKREREADAIRKRLNLRLLLAGGAAVVLAGVLFARRTIRP
jgi:hypothetical protein